MADKQKAKSSQLQEQKDLLQKYIPLWSITDLDSPTNRLLLILFRVFQALFMTYNMVHPDEYWQAIEVAYNLVYGGVDLPWEWHTHYRLRNTIYPYYLSGPLLVLKTLGLDTNYAVRMCPYLAHSLLVIISDMYLWEVGKKVVGKPATRIALIFYLTNRTCNELMIRCFTNTIETIFHIIAFYYFLNVRYIFDKNAAIMTALISLSFMMRNTSPVGWIPLLIYKVIYDGSLKALILSGIFIAIPIIGLCIGLDTLYFGADKLTITSLNFLEINVVQGLSKYFGEDPIFQYVLVYMPLTFTVLYPAVLIGYYVYFKDMRNKNQSPFLFYNVAFYLLVFSLIKHKEHRFLLPIIPFTFLIIGYLLFSRIKQNPLLIRFIIIFSVIVETGILVVLTNYHQRSWETEADFIEKGIHPHSLYSLPRYDVNYYTWLHQPNQNRTKVYLSEMNPTFARFKKGYTIPILHDFPFNICLELIDDLKQEKMRPEYVIIPEFLCGFNRYCFQTCIGMLDELGLYELDKIYQSELGANLKEKTLFRKKRYLYKLKNEFQPK